MYRFNADNYNATATIDDGSCTYGGGGYTPCAPCNNCNCTGTTAITDPELELILENELAINSGVSGTTGDASIDNDYKCLIQILNGTSNFFSTGVYGAVSNLDNIKELSCLAWLNFKGENITGAVDLSGMSKLVNVDLSWNSITSVDLTGCSSLGSFIMIGGLTTSIGNNPNSCGNTAAQCAAGDMYAGCICSGSCRDHRTLTSFTPTDSPALYAVDIIGQPLTTLDLSQNVALSNLMIGPLQGISSLDLSHMNVLANINISVEGVSSFTLNLSPNLDLTLLAGFMVKIYNSSANSLTISVGSGDVPGTSGGSGAGGLKTRVEYMQDNLPYTICSTTVTVII